MNYKFKTLFLLSRVYIFIRQPKDKGLPNYFIKPFTPRLWMVIFIWIVLATILILVLELWRNRYFKGELPLAELAFIIFETFCNQGIV